MTDFKTSVARIATSLKVSKKTGDDVWSHWTLVHNPDSHGDPYTYSQTWVVQGPCSIIVTGDMGSMVFERAGGLGLQFAQGGMEYVDGKCAAGEVWDYDGDIARGDLVAHMEELITETASHDKPMAGYYSDVLNNLLDDIDFENERAVGEWYCEHLFSDEAPPHFGRVPSSDVKRALACIDAVWAYEQAQESA